MKYSCCLANRGGTTRKSHRKYSARKWNTLSKNAMAGLNTTCNKSAIYTTRTSTTRADCISKQSHREQHFQDGLTTVVNHCSSAVIVLDEAYYGFTSESNDHLKEMLDSHERLVIMRTFSKYYALAGLRIGYACVGEDMKQLIAFSARYLGFNQLSEKIALAALDAPEYYGASPEDDTPTRRCSTGVGSAPGLHTVPLGCKLHSRSLSGYDQAYARRRARSARGIVVKFLSDPGLEDCMRITIGTEEQDARVLSAFNDIVGKETTGSHAHVHAAVGKR